MKSREKREGKLTNVQRLKVGGRFDRYKKEKHKIVRTPKIEGNRTIRQLMEILLNVRLKEDPDEDDDFIAYPARNYPIFLRAIRGLKYTSNDVEKFSIALAEFQNADVEDMSLRVGLFLSALINKSREKEFVIHTSQLDTMIDHIGWSNTKNIVIEGNTGDGLATFMSNGRITVKGNSGIWACYGMKKGEIVVKGDCGDCLGNFMHDSRIIVFGNTGTITGFKMENGEILIYGNCGDFLGSHMKSGKITVKGNAGNGAGFNMIGGEIYADGNCKSFETSMTGGKIYHKGKLIMDK